MDRPTKTKSGRWEVKGNPKDPNAKWGGEGWMSQPPTDAPSLAQIAKWVEDMEDWCEMMHESMIELRERMSKAEGLRVELNELSAVVKGLDSAPGIRPPVAEGRPS